MNRKEVVLLTGASGKMGFETFKLLWDKRGRYDLVLILRPSKKNRKKFRKYELQAGKEGELQLKIVWGDIVNREDVVKACRGIDWCLHTAALISPAADRNPEMAELVNSRGTRYLVEAIEAENPEHIKFIHVATIAEYGNRPSPIHVTRTGDPVLPSVYDHYAISKIKGELVVMQSSIKRRVSMRQTFIMIPGLFSLIDPIMFHQPFNSFMENITAHDSGRLMINCMDIPEDSDFWGNYYNVSGGAGCRTTFLEFLDKIYGMLGIRYWKVMERNWFALKNFHMQFFEDAAILNYYLNHWDGGQNLEDYYQEVRNRLSTLLKATAWCAKYIPPYRSFVEALTRKQLKKLAYHDDGTMGWVQNGDTGRINAFYGSMEAYKSIPGWDQVKPSEDPSLDHNREYVRLDHGYDESKESKAELELIDLKQAAAFRGGELVSEKWSGNMHMLLTWHCCQKHSFKMTPHAVLKGGHWCVECISPPWNYTVLAQKNPFVLQVLNFQI